MNVYVSMEKQSNGWYKPAKFSTEEPTNWVYCYEVADPEEFIAHMKAYYDLPRKTTRDEYDALCRKYGISALTDSSLEDSYAMAWGDFGMEHYHSDPKNRNIAIENTIHQSRYFQIKIGKRTETTLDRRYFLLIIFSYNFFLNFFQK